MPDHPSNLFTPVGHILLGLIMLFIASSLSGQSKPGQFREEVFGYSDLIPDSRVVINAPDKNLINRKIITRVIFYALPNGNTVEQTAGRSVTTDGDPGEWRYDIQHIAAQTRFLRENDPRFNYITVYIEASMKAWTTHASLHPDSPALYNHLIDTVCAILKERYNSIGKMEVTLSSHSGGGRFLFNYINSVTKIPSIIKRIVFIDSCYGYQEDMHADKLAGWIKSSNKNSLAVFSYVDTTVRLNGKPIVSSLGGTGYKSTIMAKDMIKRGIKLESSSDTTFRKFLGIAGPKSFNRVQILIKENPAGKIYHTVLVERNGLIHAMLMGSEREEKGYSFWGERAYTKFIELR